MIFDELILRAGEGQQQYIDVGTVEKDGGVSYIDRSTAKFNYGEKGDKTDFYMAMLTKDAEGNDILIRGRSSFGIMPRQ